VEKPMLDRETIVIVHGTFAAPKADGHPWYAPESDFCKKLDAELERRGVRARCWAHLTSNGSPATSLFAWSGRNYWLERSDGAEKLRRYLQALTQAGWKCHVIAHSHGGNVVLEALGYGREGAPSWFDGTVVTLGTPFLPSTVGRPTGRGRGPGILALLAWGTFWYLCLDRAPLSLGDLLVKNKWFWIATAVVVLLMLFCFLIYQGALGYGGYWLREFGVPTGTAITPARLVVIRSKLDEAYQLLRAVAEREEVARSTPTPSTPIRLTLAGSARIALLRDWLATQQVHSEGQFQIYLSRQPAKTGFALFLIVGIPVLCLFGTPGLVTRLVGSLGFLLLGYVALFKTSAFAAAVLLPIRVVGTITLFVRSILSDIGFRVLHRHLYPILRLLAFGLPSWSFKSKSSPVSLQPAYSAIWPFQVVELPEDLCAEAIAERDLTIGDALSTASQNFASWSATYWQEALSQMASDLTLLHTVYYRKDRAIALLADAFVVVRPT
jgi:hypothetical protein